MATIEAAYSQYLTTYPINSWAATFDLNSAFENGYLNHSSIDQTLFSVSGLVKKNLHSIHNDVAADIQKDAGQVSILNGCKITAVEIGLLATALVLAPMETVIRTVISAVVVPLAFIGAIIDGCLGCGFTNLLDLLIDISLVSVIQTALHIPETAVSAFYSHPANYNTPIDYRGHGNCHLLCGAPKLPANDDPDKL